MSKNSSNIERHKMKGNSLTTHFWHFRFHNSEVRLLSTLCRHCVYISKCVFKSIYVNICIYVCVQLSNTKENILYKAFYNQ